MKTKDLEAHLLKLHRQMDALVPTVRKIVEDGHGKTLELVDDRLRTITSQQRTVIGAVRQLSRVLGVKQGIELPDLPPVPGVSHRMVPATARKRI
jgi:hypothetical protein